MLSTFADAPNVREQQCSQKMYKIRHILWFYPGKDVYCGKARLHHTRTLRTLCYTAHIAHTHTHISLFMLRVYPHKYNNMHAYHNNAQKASRQNKCTYYDNIITIKFQRMRTFLYNNI